MVKNNDGSELPAPELDTNSAITVEENQPSRQDTSVPTSRGHAQAFLWVFALLATLLGLGSLYRSQQTLEATAALQHQLTQHIASPALQSEVRGLQENVHQLQQSQQNLQQSQQHLVEQGNALDQTIKASLPQSAPPTDWSLFRVRYYLELAQINNQWSADLQTTLALLQTADSLLSQIHDQRLFPIRQSLAKEISSLQRVPPLDLPGMLSKLVAIQDNIINLPLKPASSVSAETESLSYSKPPSWKATVDTTWHALKKLIIVRHYPEGMSLPLSPSEITPLKEAIQLNLQETQWALLQHNTPVFQLTLKQAIASINSRFDTHAAATLDVLKQLSSLQQVTLEQTKPELSTALSQLNQLLQTSSAPKGQSTIPQQEGL